MPLDLVGKLHRTVYIEGCPSTVREDLMRLLIAKCGSIDGWDTMGERLVVIFSSMNSISTAITFNGTAFGDLTSKLFLWVATESPPAGVTQQLSIAGGDGGAAPKTAEELKSAREARERRLAAIRSDLAPEIAQAEDSRSREEKLKDLCRRQLQALCTLTLYELNKTEKSLEELTVHLETSQRLLQNLQEKSEVPLENSKENLAFQSTEFCAENQAGILGGHPAEMSEGVLGAVEGEKEYVARRVEAIVAAAEDIGRRRVRRRSE